MAAMGIPGFFPMRHRVLRSRFRGREKCRWLFEEGTGQTREAPPRGVSSRSCRPSGG